MNIIQAVAEAFTEPLRALGRWLNPDRKREAVKDRALEAAQELIEIKDEIIIRSKSGFRDGRGKTMYSDVKDVKLLRLEVHFTKQFLNWRDGVS